MVHRRLSFTQPAEEVLGPPPAGRRQRRPIDQLVDLGQGSVGGLTTGVARPVFVVAPAGIVVLMRMFVGVLGRVFVRVRG
jgi:hypothetical protein